MTDAETRKTVTILFADVVGSTRLGDSLDPESLRHVMARYFDVARRCLERHGGTVEKFVGDAVMAVFGVPTVHEDDALRAVRAASDLRDELVQLNEALEQDYGVALALRTGINTGEVVTGTAERLAAGDAVNVAARLEQAAAEGEILLGEATARLARDAIRVEPVEPLTVRGKSGGVAAVRLVDVVSGAPAVERRFDSPLVGRRRELDTVRAAFADAVAQRRCRVVTVLGPPGIGKSRVAREVQTELAAEATVLAGQCLPYGDGITYWPLLEIFRQADAEDELARALEAGAPEEVFWSVRKSLERRSRERPLALVLDDIHWAEPTLLDLIEHLGTWTRDAPMLLLALARPELLDVRPTWNGNHVDLEPLSDEESEQLIDRLLREDGLDDDSRSEVLAIAEGNPLFVEQLVASVGEGRDAAAVPPTIQALLAARIDGLPPEERELLERASVVGVEFDWELLAGLSPDGRRPSGARLAALARKELIQPHETSADAFRFRHVLIRDAAYDRIPKSTRSALHERLANLLLDRREETLEEIVAYHFEQAYRAAAALGPAGSRGRELAERAGGLLAASGQRARARGDVRAAAKLIDRAADLLPDADPRRPAMLAALGRSLIEAGDIARADAVLDAAADAAQRTGQPAVAADASVSLAMLRLQTTINPNAGQRPAWDAIEAAIPILEVAGDRAALSRVRGHAGLLRVWAGRAGAAIADLEEAARHARAAGDRPQELHVLGYVLVAAVMGPMPVDEALARLHAIRAQTAATERALEQWVVSTWAHLEAMRGDLDVARELLERGRLLAEDLAFGAAFARHGFGAGPVLMLAHDAAGAEAALRKAYDELDRMGLVGYLVSIGPMLAEAVLAQGRVDEALEITDRVRHLAVAEDVDAQTSWRRARAVALARKGDLDEARLLADEAVDVIAGTDYLDDHARALAARGEVLLRAGRRTEAADEFDAAIRIATAKGNIAFVRDLRKMRDTRS